jgi:hypothetical protein
VLSLPWVAAQQGTSLLWVPLTFVTWCIDMLGSTGACIACVVDILMSGALAMEGFLRPWHHVTCFPAAYSFTT